MKYVKFTGYFTSHNIQARKLISNYISLEKIALMTDEDIEKEVNKRFIAIPFFDDWLLIDKKREKEFNDMITYITR